MKRLHSQAFALIAITLLTAGCQTIGVPTPSTFNERVAAALTTVTTVRETSTSLLNAGKISSQDHANIEEEADNVRAAITIARSLSSVDATAADAKLQSAQQILLALQSYLREQQK